MTTPDGPTLGERLIDAVAAVAAPTPGRRALHAKGVGATGTFRSTGAAARLTTAAHLAAGAEVPVTVRFSNGSAAPNPDGARDGRGMATKFHLPGGATTDIVALTLPVFFVRTPEDFLGLMAARVPDPDTGQMDLDKVFAFLAEHPEAQRAVELSMVAPAPLGYTTVAYHAIHAFWLVSEDGERRAARYHWEPVLGVDTLDDATASGRAADYLTTELTDRLDGDGVAELRLLVQLAEPGDPTDDPTVEWPGDRETIDAGTLTLESPADQAAVEAMIFDPVRVTAGIECSDDKILHARSAAYGVSYARRHPS